MWTRFWLSAVLFHLSLTAVCVLVARRWLIRSRAKMSRQAWAAGLTRDFFTLLIATVVLAAIASLLCATSGFGALRLLSQALFGELVALTIALSILLLLRGPRGAGVVAVAGALTLLGVYAEAYHREPHDLQIRTHTVEVGGFETRPLRILHMSDIQTDAITPYEERVFREAVALKPDLVFLTGDYVQPRLVGTRAPTTARLKWLLRGLSAASPLGVYAVQGDVDIDWPGVVADTGVRPLTGEAVRITTPDGRTVTIIGVTAGMSRGHEMRALRELVDNAPPADLQIVFGHNPNFVESLRRLGSRADLVLAGHTHGGQVVLPWLGAPITKMNLPRQYASGLHDYHGLALHVSAGVGMERQAAPQIRFGCPPEICLLEIR